jgi:hypothetical protein
MTDAVRKVRGKEPVLQAASWLGDTASGPGGEPVYCPDGHLSIDDIVEATRVYAAFGALSLVP